jgi:hypothetical protein
MGVSPDLDNSWMRGARKRLKAGMCGVGRDCGRSGGRRQEPVNHNTCRYVSLQMSRPPQLRFMIAVAGIAAWIAPWPWIDVSLELPSLASPPIADGDSINRIMFAAAQVTSNGYPAAADARGYVGYAVIALFRSASYGSSPTAFDCVRRQSLE